MASPETIASGASCFTCIPNKQEAILWLLAQIAGVTDPATIANEARCMACIPNKQEAMLYLLDQIATNGAGGGGGLECGAGPPVDPPSGDCGIYLDTDTDALYVYRSGAWVLKV